MSPVLVVMGIRTFIHGVAWVYTGLGCYRVLFYKDDYFPYIQWT